MQHIFSPQEKVELAARSDEKSKGFAAPGAYPYEYPVFSLNLLGSPLLVLSRPPVKLPPYEENKEKSINAKTSCLVSVCRVSWDHKLKLHL